MERCAKLKCEITLRRESEVMTVYGNGAGQHSKGREGHAQVKHEQCDNTDSKGQTVTSQNRKYEPSNYQEKEAHLERENESLYVISIDASRYDQYTLLFPVR